MPEEMAVLAYQTAYPEQRSYMVAVVAVALETAETRACLVSEEVAAAEMDLPVQME
jgi:hypothetical protein